MGIGIGPGLFLTPAAAAAAALPPDPPAFVALAATGGDSVTDEYFGDTLYRVHRYTTPGTSSFVMGNLGVATYNTVDFMIIGGGGGGGGGAGLPGGGGGGGGLLRADEPYTPVTSTVTVVVGVAGGAGTNASYGSSAGMSSLGPHRASGGGAGACGSTNPNFWSGLSGASGGGNAADDLIEDDIFNKTVDPLGSYAAEGVYGYSGVSGTNGGGGGGRTGAGSGTTGGSGYDLPFVPGASEPTYCAGGNGNSASPATKTAYGAGGDGATTGSGSAGMSGAVFIAYPLEAFPPSPG